MKINDKILIDIIKIKYQHFNNINITDIIQYDEHFNVAFSAYNKNTKMNIEYYISLYNYEYIDMKMNIRKLKINSL